MYLARLAKISGAVVSWKYNLSYFVACYVLRNIV